MFWMISLGAMTAGSTDESDWFLKRTMETAKSLGIEPDKESFRFVLKKFMFLGREERLRVGLRDLACMCRSWICLRVMDYMVRFGVVEQKQCCRACRLARDFICQSLQA